MIDDEILTEEGTRVPCKGCGVKLVVKKKTKKVSSPPPPPSSPPSPPPSSFQPPLSFPDSTPEFKEEEGFYMPEESDFKLSGDLTSDSDASQDQFFDAGFSLGGDKEEFFKEEKVDDFESTSHEFKLPEDVEGHSSFSEAKGDDEISSFDMLTESLFTEEDTGAESAVVPVEEPPKEVKPFQPESSVSLPKKPVTVKRVQIRKMEEKRRSPFIAFFFFPLLLGAIAGLYFWKGKDLLSSDSGKTGNEFEIQVLSDKNVLVNRDGERIWFIRAKVIPKRRIASHIKLKATLYDESNFPRSEIEFYAGNILKEEELRELSPFKVHERLQNRVGDMFSNVNVQPGKGVEFMAVFYDPPPRAWAKFDVVDYTPGNQ